MLGCFNSNLGHIWTIQAFGLIFLKLHFNHTFGFVHVLPNPAFLKQFPQFKKTGTQL